MYRIIGADGREYGPIAAEQVRQWIAEGRANAATRVWAEGTAEWKPLAEFLEFAPLPAAAPPPPSFPQPIGYAPTPRTNPLATTGMIMGILSVTLGGCCYGVPFNLLGIVFYMVSLAQIKQDPQNQQGRGLAIAGLVLSILSFALALLLIVFGVAVNSSSDVLRKIQRL